MKTNVDTLVDSNVIIDVQSPNSLWKEWSKQQLGKQAALGNMVINPLIYAELSLGFKERWMLDKALPLSLFRRDDLPWEAAPLAAKAFIDYRKRGGQKTSPLPDFYIGAHAVIAGMTLLTRDKGRYQTYFPDIKLIAP